MPGIGPIVADGPLAAGLGEAAGHVAGDLGRTLGHAGLDDGQAERWEEAVEQGAVLVGAHLDVQSPAAVTELFRRQGAI